MLRIYINGKKGTWKQIEQDYGYLFCDELKAEAKELEDGESLHDNEAQIDIFN